MASVLDTMVAAEGQPVPRLKIVSAIEALVSTLRADILSGVYEPGQQLTQDLVARRYSISRPTAITALSTIVRNYHTLNQTLNHSAEVPIIPEDARPDILLARKIVEVEALANSLEDKSGSYKRFIAEKASLGGLTRALYGMSEAPLENILQTEFAFHALLIQVADNNPLLRTYDQITDEAQLALLQGQVVPDSKLLAQQHEGLIESIEHGFTSNDWSFYRTAAMEHLETVMASKLDGYQSLIVDLPPL